MTVAEYNECRRLYSQLDHYYKKIEKEPKKRADSPVFQTRNAIPSDSETLENIMPSNNARSSESSSSEEDMDQETPSDKQHPLEEEQTVMAAKPSDKQQSSDDASESENNIMPAKLSHKEQSSDEASEKEKNIMPQQNINDNLSPAKDDIDLDLEKIMEDSNEAKESESCSTSTPSNSSSSTSSSGQETLSEDLSFICSTATCGEVFDTAAGL